MRSFESEIDDLAILLRQRTPTNLVDAINHQPSTINHQPSTINHQPSTINHQPSTVTTTRNPANDSDWELIGTDFFGAPGTIYLNHGSFGIPSNQVRYAQRKFTNQSHENPMDFYLVQFEGLMQEAKTKLASFLGTTATNIAFADNATFAMSHVAAGFPLSNDDEVLITDHEYVPVTRMWQQRCDQVGARLVVANLPKEIESGDQIIDSLQAKITDKTRLLVISHITSPTAIILPIKDICQYCSAVGIPVCVDGPHAPAQVELNIDQLNCDFYTASCHKWLSAPLGTGFLYVHPRWQSKITPLIKGWGRLPPHEIESWSEQFDWAGTRDVSHFLAIPSAIEYLERIGLNEFRQRSYWLANYAETALTDLFKTKPIARRSDGFYGSMTHVPLPPGDWSRAARDLKKQVGIEVVINQFAGRWFIRVSSHLYNSKSQIDLLIKSLTIVGNSVRG